MKILDAAGYAPIFRERGLDDPELERLWQELAAYPATNAFTSADAGDPADLSESGSIAVPMRVRMGDAVLSFISTTTIFGTPLDITLSELALETIFPEDETTAAALRAAQSPR